MRRREVLKGVALVLIMVGTFGAAMAWSIPGVGLWARLTWTGAAVGGVTLFLEVHVTRDRAPDFLHEQFGAYLERDGFCFVVLANEVRDHPLHPARRRCLERTATLGA